jgi:hypothetical protein
MDTNLGNFTLTDKQFSQTSTLKSDVIKGFAYWNDDGKVVVTSTRDLTPQEILDLQTALPLLPDEWTEQALLDNFNADVAIGREAQVFNAVELMRLMPYSYTINELIRFKNFWGGVNNGVPYAGLEQIGKGLVAGGQILQSDYDKLADILAEQGIVI